jgi:hypothetical protein
MSVPIPYPRASNEIVVDAIVDYLIGMRHAARRVPLQIVVARLRDYYGHKLVDQALVLYERHLKRENRLLRRQVAEREQIG